MQAAAADTSAPPPPSDSLELVSRAIVARSEWTAEAETLAAQNVELQAELDSARRRLVDIHRRRAMDGSASDAPSTDPGPSLRARLAPTPAKVRCQLLADRQVIASVKRGEAVLVKPRAMQRGYATADVYNLGQRIFHKELTLNDIRQTDASAQTETRMSALPSPTADGGGDCAAHLAERLICGCARTAGPRSTRRLPFQTRTRTSTCGAVWVRGQIDTRHERQAVGIANETSGQPPASRYTATVRPELRPCKVLHGPNWRRDYAWTCLVSAHHAGRSHSARCLPSTSEDAELYTGGCRAFFAHARARRILLHFVQTDFMTTWRDASRWQAWSNRSRNWNDSPRADRGRRRRVNVALRLAA